MRQTTSTVDVLYPVYENYVTLAAWYISVFSGLTAKFQLPGAWNPSQVDNQEMEGLTLLRYKYSFMGIH